MLGFIAFVGAVVASITLTNGPRTENSNYQDAWVEPSIALGIGIPAKKIKKSIIRLKAARISETEKEIYFYDFGLSAKFCLANDAWICLGAEGFNFAIPKKITTNRWARNGADYELRGVAQLLMLGKKIDVYVIHGRMTMPREEEGGEVFPEVTKEWVFFFSDTHGLIAFETLRPVEDRGMFIAMQSCGYAGLKAACVQD